MSQPTMDADEAAFLTALKNEVVAVIQANTDAISAATIDAAATAEAVRLAVLQVKLTTAETVQRSGRW